MYPIPLYSKILPNLYMGGTHRDDLGAQDDGVTSEHLIGFDAVVSLDASSKPAGSEVNEKRYSLIDGDLNGPDAANLVEVANWAHQHWKSGSNTLIRCHFGMNRSGLVTTLVLMKEGYSATDAIALIREKRSPRCIDNRYFENWLKSL